MNMKRVLTFALLTAFLGGCVVVPVGHDYRHRYDGYSQGRGDHPGDRYHRGDGDYPGYGQRYDNRGR